MGAMKYQTDAGLEDLLSKRARTCVHGDYLHQRRSINASNLFEVMVSYLTTRFRSNIYCYTDKMVNSSIGGLVSY